MNLRVFKDQRGHWRWTSYSSSGYQDRDGEIVATKALMDDCDRADRDGRYGSLLWWHTPKLVLGACDFNAMHGRILIESGTFRNAVIARKVAAAADRLGVSIGFEAPAPRGGVWHRIRRIERSILPKLKASNHLTGFQVKELPMATLKEQWIKAKRELGLTDADLQALLVGAEQRERTAQAQKIIYKAAPDGDSLDPLDQAYVQLRDAMDAGDAAGVDQALAQLTTLASQATKTKAAPQDGFVVALRQWYGG